MPKRSPSDLTRHRTDSGCLDQSSHGEMASRPTCRGRRVRAQGRCEKQKPIRSVKSRRGGEL
jgi:hypothetical protein